MSVTAPCLFWSDGEHLFEPAQVTLYDDAGLTSRILATYVRKACRCAQVDVKSRDELGKNRVAATVVTSELITFARFV